VHYERRAIDHWSRSSHEGVILARRGAADLPTRAEVLNAAVTVLLEKGYEAANLDVVAKAVGLSRRTLFNQFSTKEALFDEALAHFWTRLPLAAIRQDADVLADPELGLSRFGAEIASFFAPPKVVALTKMIIADGSRFPTLARSVLGKIPALNTIYNYIGVMSAAGHLDVPDTDLASRQFIGMILQPLLWGRLFGVQKHRDANYADSVVNEAVATFLARYANGSLAGSDLPKAARRKDGVVPLVTAAKTTRRASRRR
jgi:AcrR family transcriptional regulator